ncbi:MAG TPA: hypothetical protein PKA16_09795 [Ottowia sp.]|uniref:hypothetical protein n=1 Tax=Ottowia sp. TaxID=1898956 RepID=UPI002BE68642|nr:hypothetical protein [Ottowia sp.]HMN21672.1 hypothetical protein [Ottowia sp.]
MTLLLLEALGALLLFVLLIWWTMFSGRRKGELPPEASTESKPEAPESAPK